MLPRCVGKSVLLNSYKFKETVVDVFRNRQVITKYLHSSQLVMGKIFQDRENLYAHQVLMQSMKPYQLIQTTQEDKSTNQQFSEEILQVNEEFPTEATAAKLFLDFKTIANHCQETNTLLSETRFNKFVESFCNNIHLVTDNQLLETLKLLSILPKEENVRKPNFVELWNTVDIECCKRIENWSTDQLLLFCDAWYNLNLARIGEFVWQAMRKLGRRVIKMSPPQLVQTMFLCNVMRRSLYEMFDFEWNLAKCVKEMTLDELGVLAMGFFKTQTPIRNPELINYVYEKLMDELDTVQDITLVAILKVLRYSSKLAQVDIMMKLLDKIYKEKLNKISLLSCLHVALLGCDLQCCHEELIESILERFERELTQTRLKDLERICLVIALFNIKTDSGIEDRLCKEILNAFNQRLDEILKYPKCFSNCLHYLTLHGYYDKEMLASVLDAKFLKHALGSSLPMSRDIFHLDTFVKINLQNDNYTGPQISDKIRKSMGKLLTQYIPERNQKYKLNATDSVLLEIKERTSELLPKNSLKHILPNYDRPDLLICYDRQQDKTLPLDINCPEDYSGIILTRDHILGPLNSPNVDTVVVVVAGWNNVIRNRNRRTGLFDMKLKQLALLGHKPVVIHWHEWRELETYKDRMNLLRRRLSTVIKM